MAEPAETDESKSWLVQELPSVGWVIKPGPSAAAEGSGDVELGAAGVMSPSAKPQGVPVPTEPAPFLTAPAGAASSADPRTTSDADSEPLPLPNTIASPSAPEFSVRGFKKSSDDGPRLAGQAASPEAATKAMTRRSSGFDAFVIYALESGPAAKTGAGRASAISRGLKDRGLRICTQSFLAGAVKQHLSSSDEAHFMAQAAQNSDCAVILLTKQFIERVETGVFGDSCVAAFTLAKRLPNAIMAALEPELANPNSWGWNQVFARFSGRAVVDLSMRESDPMWQDAVDRLAWLLNPQLDLSRSAICTASGTGPPLCAEPSVERSDPDLAKRGYDCFISHNWGKDSQGRDNHQRVMRIASSLQSHGIQVFLQDCEAHRYSSTDEAMVDGMRRSSVALIFVTRSYIQKIEDGRVDDDCVAQFNLAKRAPAILPVVLEPELVKTGKWGWNRVYAHLSGKMIVDLSGGDVTSFPAVLVSGVGQRMQSQLDLLELRILQEAYRLHPKLMQARPPPMIPHKDVVMISTVCLIAGAVLHVAVITGQTALTGTLNLFFRLLAAVSALFWFIGFTLYTLWLVMKARLPPSFDLVPGLMQPAALVGNACRAIVWGMFLFRHVMVISGVEDLDANADALLNATATNSTEDFEWVDQSATYGFTAFSLVCFLDAWLLSRGCPGSFQESLLSAESLGGWAWVSLAWASVFMSISAAATTQNWSDVAVLEILAAVLLFLGAALLLLWLLLHPKQLRKRLEMLAAGPPAPVELGKGKDRLEGAVEVPAREHEAAKPLPSPPLTTQVAEPPAKTLPSPAAAVEQVAEPPANASPPPPSVVEQAPAREAQKDPAPAEESPPANEAPAKAMPGPILEALPAATAEPAPASTPSPSSPAEARTPKTPKDGQRKRVVSSLLKAAKDGSLNTSLKEFEAKEFGVSDSEASPTSAPARAAVAEVATAPPGEPSVDQAPKAEEAPKTSS